jgi:hypothetical protein
MPIDQLIAEANKVLEWKLYMFQQKLDVQMLLLKYGPDYLNNLLDSIILELSTDKVVGYEEDY